MARARFIPRRQSDLTFTLFIDSEEAWFWTVQCHRLKADGARLIKEMRLRLMESSRETLENLIVEQTGCQVLSLHTDLSTRTGEEVLIFVLDRNLEQVSDTASE